MTLRFIEGFDQYASAAEIEAVDRLAGSANNSTYVSLPEGRSGAGTKCIKFRRGGYGHVRCNIVGYSGDTVIVGFGVYIEATTVDNVRTQIIDSDNNIMMECLTGSTSGQLNFRNGDGTSHGTVTVGTNTWAYIEMKIKLHPTTGTLDVMKDGQSALSVTGIDTVHNSSVAPYIVSHLKLDTNNSEQAGRFDDIYVCDSLGTINNDFLGDSVVSILRPNSDSGTPDWSRSAGSANYENVDDLTIDDDSTYNYTSGAADNDLFGFEAASVGSADVRGVQVTADVRKEGSGTRLIKVSVESTESDDRVIPGTDYYGVSHLAETIDGSTPFVVGDLAALVAGYELI